jgi:hypothetical protein
MACKQAQHIVAANEVQLAGLHSLDRKLIRPAGNNRVQAQNLASLRNADNQCFAVA